MNEPWSHARLEPALARRLGAFAKLRGMSQVDLLNEIVATYLDEHFRIRDPNDPVDNLLRAALN